jgi:hypothetical protein
MEISWKKIRPAEKTSDLKMLWVTWRELPPSSTWAFQRIGERY